MNIEAEIHQIKTSLAVMEERYENDNKFSKEQSEEFKKLRLSVNQLLLVIENDKGFKAGKSTVMKAVWLIFGALIIAWVIWVSNNAALNAADHEVLEELMEHVKEHD